MDEQCVIPKWGYYLAALLMRGASVIPERVG